MQTVAVKATLREAGGSKGARDVRNNGQIPCVVYGGDEARSIAVDLIDVRNAIYTPDFKIVELDLEGTRLPCILRDVQFHPVTEKVVHIDFQRLVPGRKIKVDLPVHCEGVAPGLKAGGTLIQKLRRLSVLTKPEDLVAELIVDISELELGYSVRVKDCTGIEGIEILNEPNIPIASVEIPRALKSLEAEEDEIAEDEDAEGAGETGDAEAPAEKAGE